MRPTAYRHLLKFSAALFLLAAFLISPVLPGAEAKIIYVTQEGTGNKFGDSWDNSYDATRFVNSLNNDQSITAGDEYRVAKGKYSPISTNFVIDRANSFKLKKGVKLYGGFAGPGAADPNYRNLTTYETILTGEMDGGVRSYHVVNASDTDDAALLDGFTITGGAAIGGDVDNNGGGLYANDGNALIRYCTFRDNSAANLGAGAYLNLGKVKFEECTFTGNSATVSGGGVSYIVVIDPTLERCTFNENRALEDGGAIYSLQSSPIITNCTFFKNRADRNGGALADITSDPVITNSTFFDNTAATGGSGLYNLGSDPIVRNSILWNTGSPEFSGQALAVNAITHSIVRDNSFTGPTIINSNPKLGTLARNRGAATMTCAIPSDSPAVDKGLPVGTVVRGDVKVPGIDQTGLKRPQPQGGSVDIGAYEYEPAGDSGGGGGCQSTTPAGAAWLMIPLALVLLRRKE